MYVAPLVHAAAGGLNAATTAGIDTTGANLIVVALTAVADPNAQLTDSKSNTWTYCSNYQTTGLFSRIAFCYNPAVGSAHTFTLTQTGGACGIAVAAFSGALPSPFDQQNGQGATTGTTLACGSITPATQPVDYQLIIAMCGSNSTGTPTIDSGMTVSDGIALSGGLNYGCFIAYKIQAAAAAINPTWTFANSTVHVAADASFRAAPLVEDYWQSPGVVPPQALPFVFRDTDDVTTAVASGQPDEDYYQSPPPTPLVFSGPQQWVFEQNESSTLYGQSDEDYWANPTPPVSASLIWPLPWTGEQNESSTLFGTSDEDFWTSGVAPLGLVMLCPQTWAWDQQEPSGALFGVPEELYWINPVAPVTGSLRAFLQWLGEQNDPGIFRGQPDEDFWKSGVAPIVASLYQNLPYRFDAVEVIAVDTSNQVWVWQLFADDLQFDLLKDDLQFSLPD